MMLHHQSSSSTELDADYWAAMLSDSAGLFRSVGLESETAASTFHVGDLDLSFSCSSYLNLSQGSSHHLDDVESAYRPGPFGYAPPPSTTSLQLSQMVKKSTTAISSSSPNRSIDPSIIETPSLVYTTGPARLPPLSSSPMVPTPSRTILTSANKLSSTSSKDHTHHTQTSYQLPAGESSLLSAGSLPQTVASTLHLSAAAQQTAMDRAMAAGISKDDYEKTRAHLMDMLKGSAAGSVPPSWSSSGEASLSADSRSQSLDSLPKLFINSNGGARSTLSRSHASSMISVTSNTDSSTPSASTLRTSVSSTATDERGASPDSPGSPATSADEDEAVAVGQRTKSRAKTPMSRSASGMGPGGSGSSGDNSLSAANAAAAALGMLAASPIQPVTRRVPLSLGPSFTEHRSSQIIPPSSPPTHHPGEPSRSSSDSHLRLASPDASRSSPGSTSRQHSSSEAGSRGAKSTTPVRTRLEDIALKSSAQIRRHRERLGLGEQDEMMDLDTDARHQQISRGGSGEARDGTPSRDLHEIDPRLLRSASSSASLGLAPAFSYNASTASPSRSAGRASSSQQRPTAAHRRIPSYGNSRNQGMLDRFMETSSSPKAASAARGDLAVARPSPARQLSFDDGDRPSLLRGSEQPYEDYHAPEEENDLPLHRRIESDHQGHSTPRIPHERTAALLRSAGNDLPSPLLAQIRMLSDDDRFPLERPQMLDSPRQFLQRSHSGLAANIPASSSDLSVGGSARKRKASYDLASPRQRVLNFEASPSPSSSSPPPPTLSFPGFTPSSQKFYRNSAIHPDLLSQQYKEPGGPFGGPGFGSLSQASSQSSAHSDNTATQPHSHHYYHQEMAPIQTIISAPTQLSSTYSSEQIQHLSVEPLSRPASANSQYIPNQKESRKKEKAPKKQKERLGSAVSNVSGTPSITSVSKDATTPTALSFELAAVKPGVYDGKTKPPFSYAALIGQAIFSTVNKRMSLADIYTYIMTVYPFYKKQDAGWQNSIRHNLSLNECFVKTQRGADEPGKGCLWSVQTGTEEQFSGGNFYKKGKIPKSATTPSSAASSRAGSASAKNRKKASSIASATETTSGISNEDSFDNASVNSSSFVSSSSTMVQASRETSAQMQHQQQQQRHHYQYQQQTQVAQQQQRYQEDEHPAAAAHYYSQPPSTGPSSLKHSETAFIEPAAEDLLDAEEEDSFDMEVPLSLPTTTSQQQLHQMAQQYQHAGRGGTAQAYPHQQPMPGRHLRHQRMASNGASSLRQVVHRESTPDYDTSYPQYSEHEQEADVRQRMSVESEGTNEQSDLTGSTEPPIRGDITAGDNKEVAGSPVRRSQTVATRRALLTSPPIMSSPPTNVFARMSQPYQPLRDAFRIPGQDVNNHAATILSSPPPSGITGDVRMRRLPPPTPRSAGLREADLHASSSIFLPAPNIKPGRTSFSRKEEDGDDVFERPTLPPISMLSPASTMPVSTHSPVSSVRASAAGPNKQSSSPSSKSSLSSSVGSLPNRSPTFTKSRLSSAAEVFKTPDRFGPGASAQAGPYSRFSSPAKIAQLTSSNASRALQSMQTSTPKLPGGSRMAAGLVTPGGYYDPYEYSAVVDEELERMMSKDGEGEGTSRKPLPFPSPLDRTPKWQPWSPW